MGSGYTTTGKDWRGLRVRSRNIKPGFFKNEELMECSFAARLLFPGLWMMADRNGYMEDRPKRIKIEIFPNDNIEVDTLLSELAENGLIIRYEVDGKRYIFIPTFSRHQSPFPKEKASNIPPYEGPLLSVNASDTNDSEEDIDEPVNNQELVTDKSMTSNRQVNNKSLNRGNQNIRNQESEHQESGIRKQHQPSRQQKNIVTGKQIGRAHV